MESTMYMVMKHIKNFFPDTSKQMSGRFVVSSGAVDPFPSLLDGQYVLIEGSILNDGVWNGGFTTLRDEEFNGVVTPLKVPHDFVMLVGEIESWIAENGSNPYVSESFGGYSYTRATGSHGVQSWSEVFATRLNAWRKL